LYCEVVASPPPTRYWKKNGKKLLDCPEDQTNKCRLVFPNTRLTDSGVYECGGENSAGETLLELTLEITGNEKNSFVCLVVLCKNLKQFGKNLCNFEEQFINFILIF